MLKERYEKAQADFDVSCQIKDQEIFNMIPYTKEAKENKMSLIDVWTIRGEQGTAKVKEYIDRYLGCLKI
jgi:hypothetical protein